MCMIYSTDVTAEKNVTSDINMSVQFLNCMCGRQWDTVPAFFWEPVFVK